MRMFILQQSLLYVRLEVFTAVTMEYRLLGCYAMWLL
jgi:hypothetical protein